MARTFANAAEIRTFIASDIAPAAARGGKVHAECRAKMLPELKKPQAANAASDVEVARLHARGLVQWIRKAGPGVGSFDEAQAQIEEATSADGPDFAAEVATPEKLLKSIGEPKRRLDLWILFANPAIAESGTLEQAAGARDAAALQKAKADASRLVTHMSRESPHETVTRGLAKFAKELPSTGLSKAFALQLARDAAELKALAGRLQAGANAAVEAAGNAMEVELTAPDAAKAIRALGLKPDPLSKLKKALAANDATMQREFDAIAKDAGLATSGRETVAKLRRERLL